MTDENYVARLMRGEAELSPIAKWLNWKFLDYDALTDTFRVGYEARPEFVNALGTVHGGIVTAMLDETLGPATAAPLGPSELATTVEIKVSFVAPAELGSFVGTARAVSRGRSICFQEAQLHQQDKLIATASATMKLIRLNR